MGTRARSEELSSFFQNFFLLLIWFYGRDEVQFIKLQQLGMTTGEEAKLLAMRDYVLKLARNISRSVKSKIPENTRY